jgi:predicted metalloprotease with PDZ domain
MPLTSTVNAMQFHRTIFALIVFSVICCTQKSIAQATRPTIHYSLRLIEGDSVFRVSMSVEGLHQRSVMLHFPIWSPGSYNIIDVGRFVGDVKATSGTGAAYDVRKLDAGSYHITNTGSSLTISYVVGNSDPKATKMWITGARIEPDYAFANSVALFGYIEGMKELPVELAIAAPEGWSYALPLEPAAGPDRFHARNYDVLIDAPIQMGHFTRVPIAVNGVTNTITITSSSRVDSSAVRAITDSTRRIVEIINGFFHDTPPEPYLFQIYLRGQHDIRRQEGFFGGLEHLNATTISLPYHPGEDAFAMFWRIIAHEYFHRWNPKKFHVHELGPFDYQAPSSTSSLWLVEGITEYYAGTLLVRNGVTNPVAFGYGLQTKIVQYNEAAHMNGTMAERSLNAATISLPEFGTFYTQGALLGLMLDIEIRQRSHGTRSLDDVMRFFNERFGRRDSSFADDDIVPLIEQATGVSVQESYRRYIAGGERLPIEHMLSQVGMKLKIDSVMRHIWGAETRRATNGFMVTELQKNGAAEEAGFRIGDIITGIVMNDSIDMEASILPDDPGTGGMPVIEQTTKYTVMRDGNTLSLPATAKMQSTPVVHLENDPEAAPSALTLRRSMFGF